MKIQSHISRSEGRPVVGYVWQDKKDPSWIRFRTDLRSGIMTGIHFSSCNGTIPRGTPFRFRFRNGEEADLSSEGVSMLVLAQLSNERIFKHGSVGKIANQSEQLDAWNEFLGGQNVKSKKAEDTSLYLTVPKDIFDTQLSGRPIIKVLKEGEIGLTRGPHFSIGSPLSGFDVVKAVLEKNVPVPRGEMGDLDLESAKTALKSVARPSSAAVAWYAKAPEDVATYRMQAAAAMPILAGMIAESYEISRAVDECKPIQPLISERTGLPKAGLKRMGKLNIAVPAAPIFENGEQAIGEDALGVNRVRRYSVSGLVSVDKAMRHLADLPPDRTPKNDDEWGAFYDILTGCAIPVSNALNIPVQDILEASKGNWVEYRNILARAADFEPDKFDRRTMALTTIDAIEAIEAFSRTAMMPQILNSILETEQPIPAVTTEFLTDAFVASADLTIGSSKNVASQLFEVARRYASRIPAMMEIEGRMRFDGEENDAGKHFARYGDDQFPLLTQEFVASNGMVVRPLQSFEDLKEEGKAMSHCVGGYTSKAREGRCHLYSIRSLEDGKRHSTLELNGITGEDPITAAANISIVQNRAVRNGAPSAEATKATNEFISAVKSGAFPIRFAEIQQWREYQKTIKKDQVRAKPETTWASVLEHNWTNPEIRARLWDEWRTVMGGKIGKSNNPGAVYASPKARSLVGAMSPRAAAILTDQSRAKVDPPPEP